MGIKRRVQDHLKAQGYGNADHQARWANAIRHETKSGSGRGDLSRHLARYQHAKKRNPARSKRTGRFIKRR